MGSPDKGSEGPQRPGETSRALRELAAASGKQRDELMGDKREITHIEDPVVHENNIFTFLLEWNL